MQFFFENLIFDIPKILQKHYFGTMRHYLCFQKYPKKHYKMGKTMKNLDQFLTLSLDQFLTLSLDQFLTLKPQILDQFLTLQHIYIYIYIDCVITISLMMTIKYPCRVVILCACSHLAR